MAGKKTPIKYSSREGLLYIPEVKQPSYSYTLGKTCALEEKQQPQAQPQSQP